MRNKPDNRADNVERIQQNIDNTIQNIDQAEEKMALTDNPQTQQELANKNERRRQALDGMRHEIRDESRARDKGQQ